MAESNICLVFNAHLPFVRHPEYDRILEDKWLFEAISETYLPMLRMFNKLKDEGVKFKITFSISPTLSAMLEDDLLQAKYIKHAKELIEFGENELIRNKGNKGIYTLTQFYLENNKKNLDDFTGLYKNNILNGFKILRKEGYFELITSAATHCFLPLYSEFPEAIEAQIQTAVISHTRTFGADTLGFWLPECGYFPGLERYLKRNSIGYFFVSAHGILFADNRPKNGHYSPIICPNNIAAFGRDIASLNSVWSARDGYSSDYSYRDYHQDIAFELPEQDIAQFLYNKNIRVSTGYKYYSKTLNNVKKIYDLDIGRQKAIEHAENFIYTRLKQAKRLSKAMDKPPLFVCPFDAELFGHWWYEGIDWLENLIRAIAKSPDGIKMITPSEYLKTYPENQITKPAYSSLGSKGYSEVWLNSKNDWIYRHIHRASERMTELAERFPDESGLKLRVLNQAAREVLLSQASDWPFIIKNGNTVPYATRRLKEHLYNFGKIYDNLCRGNVSTEWITGIEKRNNIFPDIDYRVFKKSK